MKTLLWIIGAGAALTFSSCTKRYYNTTPSQTIYAQADSTGASGWQPYPSTGANSWAIDVSMPEITDAVSLNDDVSVFISYNYDAQNASDVQFEAIPEVYNGYSYSYTYQTGHIDIYAQSPTATLPAATPGKVWIKIVITPSVQ